MVLVSGNGDILVIPMVMEHTPSGAGEEEILIHSADGFPGYPDGGGQVSMVQ